MFSYIARRIIQGAITILIVSFITFGLMHLSPVDPIDVMIGEARVTEEQREAMRTAWGLDRPWYEQYASWMGNIVRGDLGESLLRPGVPVGQMLTEAAYYTVILNVLAIFFSILIAIPIGILSGIRRYSSLDYSSMLGSTLGISIPNFWLGLMLILVFSVYLGILPTGRVDSLSGWILPVIVLLTAETALLARVMRSSTIEVISQDYVTTARAKGLDERIVVWRHAVRNALLPVVTVIGYRVAFLLSGTIVVEQIFQIPGLGRLLLDAVYRSDYQVVQAVTLLLAIVVVAVNLLTDLLYAVVDPRIRVR